MTKIATLLALVLVVACTIDHKEPPALPHILPVAASGVDAVAVDAYEAGARAWEPLGFDIVRAEEVPPGQRPCSRHWYMREPREIDCHIPIRIERAEVAAEENGALGYAVQDGRFVVLDISLTGLELQGVAAHEIGHIILDTGAHAKDRGIMGAADWMMSEGDFSIACEAIGVCVEP